MGYRYENKLDEENERRYLASLSPWRRWTHRQLYRIFMIVGFALAFYAHIGWWLWNLKNIFFAVEALRLFKVVQVYPLIYAAISNFIRNGNSDLNQEANKLVKFLKALESYHFINTAVCDRIGNEVEKLYADYCVFFEKSDNFDNTANDLVLELKGKLAQEAEFISRFKEITYETKNIPLIMYIFDRFNNYNTDPGTWVKIYNSDPKVYRKSHNIEHFLPQNPKDKNTEDTIEYINNIGNLLAIHYKTNSRLGNLSPKEKISKLTNELESNVQNIVYIKDFINSYGKSSENWGKESISIRAESMAKEAYSKIWKI